jgi:hypothetical protein
MKIKDVAVVCQWCYVCYAGSKKCLGSGFDISFALEITVARDGYCKLCSEGKCPGKRRRMYKMK